jgi:hypothetical protein
MRMLEHIATNILTRCEIHPPPHFRDTLKHDNDVNKHTPKTSTSGLYFTQQLWCLFQAKSAYFCFN